MKPINDQYKQAILYNEILVRKSDDWLQNIINTAMQADQAKRNLASMKQQMNEINNQSVTTTNTKSVPVIGSIAELEANISSLKLQYKNAADDGTRAGLNTAIKYAETQLKMMQLRAAKMELLSGGSLTAGSNNALDTSDLNAFRNIEPASIVKVDTATLDYINTMATLVNNISGATDNATASWLQYSANIISSVASMLPAMASLFGITSALGIAEQSKLM